MNVQQAAYETAKLIKETNLKQFDETHTAKDHLHMMIGKVGLGEVEGEKAHLWLGWVQACIVMSGGATVHEMKRINGEAEED